MPEAQDIGFIPDVLREIVRHKRGEVERLQREHPGFENGLAVPQTRDLAGALRRPGEVRVMAEIKRRSPGAGAIRPELIPSRLAHTYERFGAAAVSVLTDEEFFAGSLKDLVEARAATSLPVLRKDFVLDEVQILEARQAGADAVLLIARILDGGRLAELARFAEHVGLAALVEVHDRAELDLALTAGARLVGINNRDLTSFRSNLETTLSLACDVPSEVVLVSESGIRGREDVERVGSAGVDAVLVGEWILRHEDVGTAIGSLVGRPKGERGE